MRIPGGIRVRLAVAVIAVVGGALLGAYLMAIPSLERRLVDAKLDQLEHDANQTVNVLLRGDYLTDALRTENATRGLGLVFDARIVVLDVIGNPPVLVVFTDTAGVNPQAMTRNAVALAAVRTNTTVRMRVERDGVSYAELATPLFPTTALVPAGGVVFLSASLGDQLATVHLIQRRLLYASAVALAIAFALGSGAAALHARRIRRLERAARRIAAGAFDEPITDHGRDELGELAREFDRMRVQLAQLDNARKEFVANASHELRTPLFSLAGFLELLTDEELDEDTRRGFLATTRQQVERLTSLATDLLDLSRMDAGRLRLAREDVSLGEVANVLVDELHPLAEASGHRLSVEANGEVIAHGDEERVIQIGRALARNALVHAPAGSRVILRTRRLAERVALDVEDDGPGISAEHLERIFNRFYRIDGVVASGSGLGLAIARELAELMGGSLGVESRPGRTVFTLELPADVAEQAERRPLASVST
jgi:signal transduction histidine kinase